MSRRVAVKSGAGATTTPPLRRGSLFRPWGLPDGLGFILGVSLVVWWPWATSTTSLLALTILTTGSFAILPAVARRWRGYLPLAGLAWIPLGAAGGVVAWALVSTVFSGAPWAVSVYGWEGRQDGLLALVGVAILLAGAASLRYDEIERVISWVLLAGAVLVAEAMLQLAGWDGFRTAAIPGVWAAMANPNFLAAMCGMLAALALSRALDRDYVTWQRVAVAVLLAGLVAASILTQSAQGPVTLVVGCSAVLGLRLLQCEGRRRIWIAIGLAVAAIGGVALTLLGLFGIGPLTRLWASESTAYRKSFWGVALRTMEGLPFFGTGPGGLSRYVGEFRSEQYVIEQGPGIYVDAAHNVPLQYGATLGVVGLVCATFFLGSVLAVALVTAWRATRPSWLIAGVGAMAAVYVSQSLISIDELRLKEMGWVAAGLVVALYRARDLEPSRASRGPGRWWPGLLGGGVGLLICIPALWATAAQQGASSLEEAMSLSASPLLSCERRMQLVARISTVQDLQATWNTASRVAELDPRCPQLASSYAELALLSGDAKGATRLGALAVETDPLNALSWLVQSFALEQSGDFEGARAARERAEELQSLRQLPNWSAILESLSTSAQSRN